MNTKKRKSLLTALGGIALLIVVSIYSCKKEMPLQSQNGANNYNLSLIEIPDSSGQRSWGGKSCLNFLTIEDYENAISQTEESQCLNLSNLINSFTNYTSYSESHPNDTLIDDESFSDLLNQDGVIKIGSNYFKIDPVLNKVFVLKSIDGAYYSDLVAAYPQSGKVIMFNMNDDVLGMIKSGALLNTELVEINLDSVDISTVNQRGALRWIKVNIIKPVENWWTGTTNTISQFFGWNCGESSITIYQTATVKLLTDNRIEAKAYYRQYGIYYHLFGEIVNVAKTGGYKFAFVGGIEANTGRPDNGYVYYKPKCVDKVTQYETTTAGTYITFGTKRIYHSYQGSKPLNQYYFAYYVIADISGNYPISPLVQIRDNK